MEPYLGFSNYEMKNLKRSETEDRLSELPDSVIFDIFWRLPMTDVVRTTVLSKRWRNLWSATPFLNFSDDEDDDRAQPHFYGEFSDRIRNFVNRALLRWDGVRILKFKVDFLDELQMSIYSDIDSWLAFAKRNGVEELYLHFLYYYISIQGDDNFDCKKEVYWVPQFLYSCSSFKELSFKHCNFGINGNVEWNHLKKLKIEGFEVTGLVITQILCGSPLLEILILSFIEIGDNYSIRSSSLKELSIYKHFKDPDILFMDTELRIWSPNLETLEIRGVPYGKCLLLDISSLIHVTLGISGIHRFDEDGWEFPGIDVEQGLLSTSDFLGDKFSSVVSLIQHVENISLLFCCIEVLEATKKRCIHSSFHNVKSLQIGDRFNKYDQLVDLLQIFPQLERLALQSRDEDEYHEKPKTPNFDAESHLKFESNLPESFLVQLRIVEVDWLKDDNIFPFIEHLLKYASKLEKMVFRVIEIDWSRRTCPPPPSPLSNPLSFASQKLSKMPRSSPSCTVDILHLILLDVF